MSKTREELQAELDRAHKRIAELEAYKPLTINSMKRDISKWIGAELSGGQYSYGCTVAREDMIKIHAWIKAKVGAK